jgi:hypothetical protein
MIGIAVLAVTAIVLVWKFPRSPQTAATPSASNVPARAAAGDGGRASKPAPKSPASGGLPSPACLECQKRECWNLIDGCGSLSGNAADGPAAGTPRKQLCEQMLECARSTGCDWPVSIGCYCGQTDIGACLAGKGKGACRQAVEAAAETTESGTVFQRLKDKAYASGVVEPLLTCETRGCSDDCVPYYR